MDTRRYPISPSILQTYTGAGFALIGVSVVSFLVTMCLVGSLFLMSDSPGASGRSNSVRVSRSRGGGAGGGLGIIVILLGTGMAAGFGAKTPFKRAAEAGGSYIELDAERFLWVKNPREQVSFRWSEVKDVYSTDTTMHIAATSGKAEVPAEFSDFEDLVSEVKRRSGR